jgi:hypothetical protein
LSVYREKVGCEQSDVIQLSGQANNLCINAVNCFIAVSQINPKIVVRNEALFE